MLSSARNVSSLTTLSAVVVTVILTSALVLPAGTRPAGTCATICVAVGVPTDRGRRRGKLHLRPRRR